MVDPFFGSVLSAGASLLGGLFGSNQQDKANERAAAEAAANRRLQDEVNRRGLTMRADDAMNAYKLYGIHPLAMLGVQGPSYTPVTSAFMGGNPMGEGIARAGQDISRGMHASADRELKDVSNKLAAKQLENATIRGGLENELLAIQIRSAQMRLNQVSAPTVPSPGRNAWLVDGQGDLNTELRSPMAQGAFKTSPMNRESTDVSRPHQSPAAIGSVTWAKTSDGGYTPLMSKDYQERSEDQNFQSLKHFFSNTVVPMFSPSSRRAPFDAPGGYHWYVDYKGDWYLRRNAPMRLKGRGWRE